MHLSWTKLKRLINHPLYSASLTSAVPSEIKPPPDNLFPGVAERGRLVLSEPFINSPDAAMLSGPIDNFDWLPDAIAINDEQAHLWIYSTTIKWLQENNRVNAERWAPMITAKRIANWYQHFHQLWNHNHVDSADTKASILYSLAKQTRHLNRLYGLTPTTSDRFTLLTALMYSGFLLSGFRPTLERNFKRLRQLLVQQILADGCHFQRNPSKHMEVLKNLIIIRHLCSHNHYEIPDYLQHTIDRMTPMLATWLMGDGTLAQFNGGLSGDADDIRLLLNLARQHPVKPLASAPHSGFIRLTSKKLCVVMDVGQNTKTQTSSHFGFSSFEFSAGRQRIIVNCGQIANAGGSWAKALTATAAHSTLTINNKNSGRQPKWWSFPFFQTPTATSFYTNQTDGHCLIEYQHNGYQNDFDIIHKRSLFMHANGQELKGEDLIELSNPSSEDMHKFSIRFHLFPNVRASLIETSNTVLLKPGKSKGWHFTSSGGDLSLEDSVYFENGVRRHTQQIVVSGSCHTPHSIIKWRLLQSITNSK